LGFQPLRDAGDLGLRLDARYAGLQPGEALDPRDGPVIELVAALVEGLLHGRRHPELDRIPDEGAVETLRGHADDRVRHPAHELRLAEDPGIAPEAVPPHPVADHDNRM